MKLLIITLLVFLAGCGADNSGPSEAEKREMAQRRFKAPGVCGDAALAQALSANKWCAADRSPEEAESISFNSSNCSVIQTMNYVVQHETGEVSSYTKAKFDGKWHIDLSSDRPLNLYLEDFSPMYHTVEFAEGPQLKLTDVRYIPCATAAEPEAPVESEVIPETEI